MTNLTGTALGFLTMSMVPRALGAADFGRFEFVTVNLNLLIATLGLSFPVAFFNWVSREDGVRREAAIGLTTILSLAVAIVTAALIAMSQFFGFDNALWPDTGMKWVWLGFLFSILTFFVQNISYLADGTALSVGLESRRMAHNIARAVLIVAFFAAGFLNLVTYFWIQIVLLAGLTFWLSSWLIPHVRMSPAWFRQQDVQKASREFADFAWGYSKPLIVYGFISLAYGYVDRWVLQFASGPEEQAYYGLAYRFGTITFIFTSAMTPVLTREFAVAHGRTDTERLGSLFGRIRMFVMMASILGGFLAVHASAITRIFAGKAFEAAALPVAIMAFYPVHQTFGQLSNALMMAAGQTRLYSRLGMTFMLISVPISYFLLASPSAAEHGLLIPGLGLGATGLALKMVGIQIIATNVFLYFNTKTLDSRYLPWVWFQIVAIALPVFCAFAGSKFGAMFAAEGLQHLVISGLIYSICIGLACLAWPGLLGISGPELQEQLRTVRRKLGI